MTIIKICLIMNVGQKIARLREIRGVKQTDLARRLEISQQALSRMENNDFVDDKKLKKVAEALGVSTHAILNFQEDTILEEMDKKKSMPEAELQFNPIEKILELYEQLLATERKRIELLEGLLRIKEPQIFS